MLHFLQHSKKSRETRTIQSSIFAAIPTKYRGIVMIITPEILASLGFRVSNLRPEGLQRACTDAELGSLKPVLGDETYTRVEASTTGDDYVVRNGGTTSTGKVLAGLQTACGHLAMCELCRTAVNSTSFGVVRKDGDHSYNADIAEMQKACAFHLSHASQYIRECCEALGIKFDYTALTMYQDI